MKAATGLFQPHWIGGHRLQRMVRDKIVKAVRYTKVEQKHTWSRGGRD
jgi:hypothetical protein